MEKLKKDYHLVWSDEFDYEGLPAPDRWNYDLGNHQWANRELQSYTDHPDNVYVKDGRLTITARKEQDGEREYTSTRLTTYDRQSWQYGLFEFRVKLPMGVGSWPAVWMLSDAIKTGTPWPLCGEIDIIEHAGKNQDQMFFSLHSEKHNHTRKESERYTVFKEFPGVSDDFHDYHMEWTSDYVEFYVDGVSACRFNKNEDKEDQSERSWPFDQPFYLIFNIAVGGTMGGDVVEADMPFLMEIEHVRVYQKNR